jgi:hypothetical protein
MDEDNRTWQQCCQRMVGHVGTGVVVVRTCTDNGAADGTGPHFRQRMHLTTGGFSLRLYRRAIDGIVLPLTGCNDRAS